MKRNIILIILIIAIIAPINIIGKIKVSSYDMQSAIKASDSKNKLKGASVIATSDSETLDVLGFWFVNSGLTYSDDVVVMRVAFNNFLFDSSDGTVTVDDINVVSDVDADLLADPLVYPNPMRFSEGGTLQYILSTAMDIEIHMYDIFGRKVYENEFAAGGSGGYPGINEITLDKTEFGGYTLGAGVYFYIFIYEDEVIGRGKVAVVP